VAERLPGPGRVAAELLAFGEELAAQGAAQVGETFTDLPEADALIKSSPEAFLLGVLFTQGIAAEKAWSGPWLLQQRLGHLDLARLAAERGAVEEAVCRRPALHRFTHTVAGWVSDAALRLLDCWDGDASRIWAPGSTALEVTERLSEFRGIGRKKAAMSVEILSRHFGVRIAELAAATVAYDTHVRRVFLRAGLARMDTPDEIARAAAAANPGAPGRLDLPAWLVGRQWCRPRLPDCASCRLGDVCPRLTYLTVEGVGARRKRDAGRSVLE
jgi:uncharacterized HhH-GPD family protein